MKLQVVLILGFLMQSYAIVSQAQTNRLNLQFDNNSLKEVLQILEDQTDFSFVYKDELINSGSKVTGSFKEKEITEVLENILEDLNLTYMIKGKAIVILPRDQEVAVRQQKSTVKGNVMDSSGAPLPGVTVVVKGTTQGTVSDFNGNYSLVNVPENATLVFSFVGMKKLEVPVGNRAVINEMMEEETIGIEEVISIGYGFMKKSDLTGSVARVNMEEKTLQANTNILAALSGTTAGVNIDQTSALAGEEPQFSIRGATSLSVSGAPLVVLDGIIYTGSISNINIDDVESIDVLKDASAAAVYGARSANGVILINTKQGKTEKPTVSFDMYYGYQDQIKSPMKVMNAEQYAVKYLDYYYQQTLYKWYATHPTSAEGKPVRPDATNREVVASYLRYQEERDNYMAGNSVDWVDAVLRKAPIQNYNLSFSGKSQKSNYFISGSYTSEEGILKNDQFSRFTVRSNLESKITDWLTLSFNSSYSYLDYSGLAADLGDARHGSPLADNKIGRKDYDMYLLGEQYTPYPLNNLYVDDKDIRNNLFLVGSAKITVPWIKGLSYQLNYSNDYTFNNSANFYPPTVPGGSSNNGKASKSHSESRHWVFDNIMTYLRTFGDHQVNVTLLYSRDARKSTSSSLSAEGFDNQTLGYNNIGLGTLNKSVGSGASKDANLAYMGRVNYSYKSRYLLTGTVRKDGYSGFGADKKFGVFPSVSVGWVLSEEPFLMGRDFPYLKIRTSYGVNGNQGLGAYNSLARIAGSPYVYGSETVIGLYPSTLENADLGWERTASTNIGVDYAFLDRRISGSVEVYKAKTTDVLVQRTLPSPTGFSSVWTNLGGLDNKGLELQLSSINFKGGHGGFQWTTDFTFSLNRDKITDLYGDGSDQDIGNSWFVGEPIGVLYDLEMAGGLWTEEELYNGETLANWYPGQVKYVDQNDDKVINANDRKIIGYREPWYRFSVYNTLSWKNLTLDFYINSVQGGNGYYKLNNASALNVGNTDHTLRENIPAVRPYWTPDNGVDNATGVYSAAPASGGIYQNRSFVRLQHVTLSYKFSPRLLHALDMKSAQVFISGKNLYTWTKWSGWDPETASTSSGNHPSMRNLTVGIKLAL